MLDVRSRSGLQRLVDDKIAESLILEYKASEALSKKDNACNELCKDVSALANSAGGHLIYGIVEKFHKPVRVDEGATPDITREWMEQVLNSRIQPRIQGLLISPIEIDSGRYAYVITVPAATALAPHQAPNKLYYRRFNFAAVPMADYEIRDMMRRSTTPDIYIRFTFRGGTNNVPIVRENNGTSAIQVQVRAKNLSPTPATFGTIFVLANSELALRGGHYFASDFDRSFPHLPPHQVYRRDFSIAGAMPIFREQEADMGSFYFALSETALANQDIYFIGYSVQVPGCSRIGRGRISISKSTAHIEMEEPGV